MSIMSNEKTKKKFQMPNTWIIVFAMVVIVAILSWIIPPGEFKYETVEINGSTRNLAIADSFEYLEEGSGEPTGVLGVFSALYRGCVNMAGTIFMVFTCCATFRIMVQTGAFHAGIGVALKRLGKSSSILIIVMMIIFGLCGSVFGMLSELYGFYPLVVGLAIALGYDAMLGMAILALGEYIGFAAGTLNPYNVMISQGIAQVEVFTNLGYRWVCFAVMMAVTIAYVLWYGARIKKDPTKSPVYGEKNIHSFSETDMDSYKMTKQYSLVLVDLAVTLVILAVGLLKYGWGSSQLCGLFIAMSVVGALIMGWSGEKYVNEFVEGIKSMAWGALIAGIAGGIMVVMNDAKIIDTIINFLAEFLKSAPNQISAQLMLVVQTLINLPICSSTGQAAVTMPIMAPLGDALNISRDGVCLIYQLASGLTDIIYPVSNIVIVCGLSGIKYEKWVKWVFPLVVILLVVEMLLISLFLALRL